MPNDSSVSRVGLLLGDATGIGPELTARLLARSEARGRAEFLIMGDPAVWREGQRVAGLSIEGVRLVDGFKREGGEAGVVSLFACGVHKTGSYQLGHMSPAAGVAVMETLRCAADALMAGALDGVLFAPLNKQAMKRGGLRHDDELHLLAELMRHEEPVTEFNVLDGLWTSRVTSHIPLKDVAAAITPDGIGEAVRLIHGTLVRTGKPHPRIKVAAFNPHAGEGGLLGSEEEEIIAPAVRRLQTLGFDVSGPIPADILFRQRADADAIVTMYHDQGQIAMKLLGFERGVTVQGGLPYPVTTPAHGTAHDIAGKGQANPGAMIAAFDLLLKLVA